MTNKKTVCFDNEIIKQGNSYCIRIPKGALGYMGFELGDTVAVTLSKPKEEKLPRGLLDIYRKNIKDLKDFSDKELNSCFFSFSIENHAIKDLKGTNKERVSKAFEKTLELQKGKNFQKKYQVFKKNITKTNMLKVIESIKKSKFKELSEVIDIQMKD